MIRCTVFTVALMLCVGLAGCKGHTSESLNAEGESLFKQGNYNGAIVHYKNALEKNPNFVAARYNLGLAYIETGKMEQAEREFQKVLLQNPYDGRVNFQLARIANFQNKPALAVPLIMAYLKEHPDDAAALEQLAISATISGDPTSARGHLEKALAVEPGSVSAKLGLIQILIVQGDRAGARTMLDELLGQDPDNRSALHALAQLEAQEKDPEAMLDVYSRISSAYPSDLFARYKEGSLLMGKGEGEKVRTSAEAMIRDYPESAEGHRLMGLYLFREGKFDEAATALGKSLRIKPDLETYYLLGLVYYNLGNLELAVTQFQTVLDYSPGFVQARIMQGEIFLRQGRGPEALVVAGKLVEGSPEDYRGHVLKGDALLMQGKAHEALSEFNLALGLAPSHYGLLLKTGLLRLSLGDRSGENELAQAVKISPEGVDARMALHTYYFRNGRTDEALAVLTEGLNGSRNDAVLYNALAKASLGRKDAEGAEEYLAKARSSDPAFLQTYYHGAIAKLFQNKLDEAVTQYDLALGFAPNDLRALIASAAVLEKQGKLDEARVRLEKARATRDTGAILMLSSFLQRNGKSDEALTVLDQERTRQPENMVIVQGLAKLHVARKEMDKAMTLYDRLEQLDLYAGTMERLRAWMAAGDLDKAEESARRLIQLKPGKGQAYLPLASILEMRKNRSEAESVLVKGWALEPLDDQVGVVLGEFQLRGREAVKALATFDQVLTNSPANAHALTGKGMALQLLGKNDEAARMYLQAVQARHDHVPALNNLAMIWADDEEKRPQAVNLAMAAFVLASNEPSIMDTLGYALIRNNRPEEALGVLARALTLAPGNPGILYHQGLAQAELGRTAEAKATLEVALTDSDFAEREAAEKLLRALSGK
jgi:putative PEP-CTERM system TPR-repeat lipoprotein